MNNKNLWMRITKISVIAGLFVFICINGCGSGGGYSGGGYVPPRTLTIAPQTMMISTGSTQQITATNGGGEAIQLFTDWSIQEGAVGGTLSPAVTNPSDATKTTVTYTAPAQTGVYHVYAKDHVEPSKYFAVTTITVVP